MLRMHNPTHPRSSCILLQDADFDLAVLQVPQALHEEAPLQPKGSQEQVDAHAAEAVALEEGHEEPEANEDHDMNILEHWRKQRWGQFVLIVKQASALCLRGSDVGLRAIKVNQIKCWK